MDDLKIKSTENLTVDDLNKAIEAVKATNKTLREINNLFDERISAMRSNMTPEDFADCARPSRFFKLNVDEDSQNYGRI